MRISVAKPFITASFTNVFRQMFGLKTQIALVMVLLAFVFLMVNDLIYHYPAAIKMNTKICVFLPILLSFYLIAPYVKHDHPRLALFAQTWWMIYGVSYVCGLLCMSIQFTPFQNLDAWFYQMDRHLGYNIIVVMDAVAKTHGIKYMSLLIYKGLTWELFLFPLLLALLNERQKLEIFFISALLSVLIGSTIYYFFPSTDPSSVLHSPYFLSRQLLVVQQFDALHHYHNVAHADAGLIGFPSFHTIWAILITYPFIHRKILLYPIAMLNLLVIASTLTLGWHFLVDDLAGIMIAIFSIAAAEYLFRKYGGSLR